MLNLDCETDERLNRIEAALSRALNRLRDREDSYRRTTPMGAPVGAPAVKRQHCALLWQYVYHTIEARKARKAGYVGTAQKREGLCETIYQYHLPEVLRW